MQRKINIAEHIYQQLKQDIFDFQLLPGTGFSETEIAQRMQASRTPVREALYRLERDGYVEVHFRSGWQVKSFDFQYFENLYEVRILLEVEAVKRLCSDAQRKSKLNELINIWCCKKDQRHTDSALVADMDEEFHYELMQAVNNQEMVLIHRNICEKLRIIRRLDFTQSDRIQATYQEHSHLLDQIIKGDEKAAINDLKSHIEISKNTVRNITLYRIQEAKKQWRPK